MGAIRSHWPEVEILVRADSPYACPEVLDWCEANGLDSVLGLAPTRTLRRHISGLEESTAARFDPPLSGNKVRRFREFFDARHAGVFEEDEELRPPRLDRGLQLAAGRMRRRCGDERIEAPLGAGAIVPQRRFLQLASPPSVQ
jgi:hypothetical protein